MSIEAEFEVWWEENHQRWSAVAESTTKDVARIAYVDSRHKLADGYYKVINGVFTLLSAGPIAPEQFDAAVKAAIGGDEQTREVPKVQEAGTRAAVREQLAKAGETSAEFDAWWDSWLSTRKASSFLNPREVAQASFAAGRAASGGQRDDIPLCGNHAEWWFCERNHLPNPNEPCVVCAMLAAPAAPELSAEQVQELRGIGAALEGNAEYYLEQLGNEADLHHGTWLVGLSQQIYKLANALLRASQAGSRQGGVRQ